MAHFGIIGAGISGLTLAWKLQLQGHRVTVWEASSNVGGAIRSERSGDWLAEHGPNSIQDSDHSVSELVESLGLTPRLIEASTEAKRRFIVRNKKPVLVPNSPLTAITTPLFSLAAKFNVLAEPFRSAPQSEPGFDEDLASFVSRRLGNEFLDYTINPMVGGIYAGRPEKLSVRHAFPKVYALETEFGSLIKGALGRMRQNRKSGKTSYRKRVLSFPNGLGELTNELANKLGSNLLLNQKVLSVRRFSDRSFSVITTDSSRSPSVEKARPVADMQPLGLKLPEITNEFHIDRVVYAGTMWHLNDIQFQDMPGLPDALISDMTYAPVVTLTLGFKKDHIRHPLDGFGILIPEVEHFNILGCLFTSSIFPHRAPDGYVTMTAFVGGMRSPELVHLPDSEIKDLVITDLNKLIGISGEVQFSSLFRWKKAIPQYETGFQEYLDRMKSIEDLNPGFYFTGNYRTGISLDACIRNSWNHTLV